MICKLYYICIPALPACNATKIKARSKLLSSVGRPLGKERGKRRSEKDEALRSLLHKGEIPPREANFFFFFFHSLSGHTRRSLRHKRKPCTITWVMRIRNQDSPTYPTLTRKYYVRITPAQIVPYLRNPIELSLSEHIQAFFFSSSFHLWCPTFIHIFIVYLAHSMTRQAHHLTAITTPQV
jgi:hypothetical protein